MTVMIVGIIIISNSSIPCRHLLLPQNASAAMVLVTEQSKLGHTIRELEPKALLPIVVTLLGIITEASLAQLLKAKDCIDVTPVDIVTDTKDEQVLNAYCPKVVTLPGMEIDTKDVQKPNAYSPRVLTLLGMETDTKDEQE